MLSQSKRNIYSYSIRMELGPPDAGTKGGTKHVSGGGSPSPAQEASERRLADAERERLTGLIREAQAESQALSRERDRLLAEKLLSLRQAEYQRHAAPIKRRISHLNEVVRKLTAERERVLPYCSDPQPRSPTSALAHAVRVLRDVRR